VRVDAGKLVVESTGVWPLLDFEKGEPVVLFALSDHEFFVDADDDTRIAFVRDAAGKVAGAVLNPGRCSRRERRSIERVRIVAENFGTKGAGSPVDVMGNLIVVALLGQENMFLHLETSRGVQTAGGDRDMCRRRRLPK
jgi:hypothetical protein